jgi:hypothetical protein
VSPPRAGLVFAHQPRIAGDAACPRRGRAVRILADDAQPVEYGAALTLIE